MDSNDNIAGALLTCDNDDCGCELQINTPCPHGDTYTCACGHEMKRTNRHEQGASSP